MQQDADEVRDALTDAVQSFAYAVLPGIELVEKLPIPIFARVRKARERLDRIILRVIAERRAAAPGTRHPALGTSHEARGTTRPDLIAMLLAACDPENPAEPGMSDQQIRDEAMTIFLAGHETTANAMAWTWHLLGGAPDVTAHLHEEIDRVTGGRIPTVEDVPKLAYARAIIAESMRLYPPAWTMGRKALEAHTIGGYQIEPNALVLTSQWVVHRDPRWWPEAEAFRPERWLESGIGDQGSGTRARPKFAYFPFGGGARLCIGESFAWTEAILSLRMSARAR